MQQNSIPQKKMASQVPHDQYCHNSLQHNELFEKSALKAIFQKYEVDSDDCDQIQCLINDEKIEQASKRVKKSKRSNFLQDIKNLTKKPIPQQQGQCIEAQIMKLFQEYKIKEQERSQALKLTLSGQIDQVLLFIKKIYRKELKTKLQKLLQSFNTKTNQDAKFLAIFKKYQIDEQDYQQILEMIKNRQYEQVSKNVKKTIRSQFIQSLKFLQTNTPVPNPIPQFQKIQTIKQDGMIIRYHGLLQKYFYQQNQEIKTYLNKKFGIVNYSQYTFELDRKQIDILQIQSIQGRVLQITDKLRKYYRFYNEIKEIYLHKNISSDQIKNMITIALKKQDSSIGQLSLTYLMEKQNIRQIENLQKQQVKYGTLKQIIVQAYVQIHVFYEAKNQVYYLLSSDKLIDLRKKIDEQFLVFEAQSLFYQNENQQKIYLKYQDCEKSISDIVGTDKLWNVSLRDTHTLQFYGFHENRYQTFSKFSEFILESEIQIIDTIKNSDFHDRSLEELFFNCFLKSLFNSIKKRFPIQTIIDKFRQYTVSNKSENLWMPYQEQKPVTMNQAFVLNYLLYNFEEKLRISAMKLVKGLLPLPLYFRKFENILDVEDQMIKNQEISWILKQGITVTSFGLHNCPKQNIQKGKSTLLNHLFYTNYIKSQSKHSIVKKIPYIEISVYQQLFPLNIIDIPSDCPEQIKSEILKHSNMLIIHSWLSKKQSFEIKTKLQSQLSVKVLLILRDSKVSQSLILKNLKNESIEQKNQCIEVPNLSNTEKVKSFIDLLRTKVNQSIKDLRKNQVKQNAIMGLSDNELLDVIRQPVQKIVKDKSQNLLRFLQNSKLFASQEKSEKQKLQFFEKGLHPSILELIESLSCEQKQIDLKIDYFRQKVRQFQNQTVSNYMKIYKIKQRLLILEDLNQAQSYNIIQDSHAALLQMMSIYPKQRYILGKQISDINKTLEQMIYDFQNKIRPKILSIELFWRQIYTYFECSKILNEANMCSELFQITSQMKSKQALNNQPFQIIDGDSLKMHKDIMKQAFKPIPDKCLVITILGPQSSGKSTLLNFLFGCDFATSQGRCTRGVYGTFFSLKDSSYTNFDGIFVIDTQGLFALTSQNDQKQENREDFDSKLVLFCLAISDVVIINVRGNLDANTEKILRLCSQKLQALYHKQQNRPEVVIVLNQNSTSKTEESENQFKKIRKTFKFRIAKSLSLAYTINNYSHKDILVLAQNQVLTRKQPLIHFKIETQNLLDQIMKVLKNRTYSQTITEKIDKFYSIWSTVLTFPTLSKMKSKQSWKLENQIKQWRKQAQTQIQQKLRKIIKELKQDNIDPKKTHYMIQNLNSDYLEEYKNNYKNLKANKQFSSIILNEQKQILQHNQNKVLQLEYIINQINFKKQYNRQRFEGDYILKQKEKQILRNQNLGLKEYTTTEKQEIFNQCFTKILQNIKKSIRVQQKCRCAANKVYNQYSYLIKSHSSPLKEYGLPNDSKMFTNLLDNTKMPEQEFQQILQNKLCQNITAQNFLRYSERPHTNILKANQSDVKLKYLNVKDYFEPKWIINKLYVSSQVLGEAFQSRIFIQMFQNAKQQFSQQYGEQKQLWYIYEQLEEHLRYMGIVLDSFQIFYKVYQKNNEVSKLQKLIKIFKIQKPSLSFQRYCTLLSKEGYLDLIYLYKKSYPCLYFNPQKIQNLYKRQWLNNKHVYTLHLQEQLRPQIQEMIEWGVIRDQVSRRIDKQKRSEMQKKQGQKFKKQVNEDLKLVNLKFKEELNFLKQISQNMKKIEKPVDIFQKIFEKVQPLDQKDCQHQFKSFQQIQKKLNKMKFFKPRNIIQNIKKQRKYINKSNKFIGFIKQTQLISKTKEFKHYQQNNSSQLSRVFKKTGFQKFIIDQLSKNQSLTRFVQSIFKIINDVKQSWGQFSTGAIGSVFNTINQQITVLNDDLNQVSNQLTPKFMGQIHLMIIKMIQKYEIDHIMLQENEIYQKKLQNKSQQLRKFILRTSLNIDQIKQEQANIFYQNLLQILSQQKQNILQGLLQENRKQFQQNYTHKSILSKIDQDILGDNYSYQSILEFIKSPHKILGQKYQQAYQMAYKQLQGSFIHQLRKLDLAEDLKNGLQQLMNSMIQIQKMTQNYGSAQDIFMTKNEISDSDYSQQSKRLLFAFFIDIITHNDPDRQRQCIDVKIYPKKKISYLYKMKDQYIEILKKMKFKQMKITNLPKFISIIMNQAKLQNFCQKFQQLFELKQSQKKNFINSIRIVVCPQKCPCCGRICGIQKPHTFHKCLYGHQMRALAGNYIQSKQGKKQAFVMRCDDIEQTEVMQFNGNKLTWLEFKNYWSKKPVGGWNYDDIQKNIQSFETEKTFKQLWKKIGPIYCKQNSLIYNQSINRGQQQQQIVKQVHFIFALDGSSSMSGKRWNGLMHALQTAFNKIQEYQNQGGTAYVTILLFHQRYDIMFQRKRLNLIDLKKIKFPGGSTRFNPVFKGVGWVTRKTICQQKIVFIFMTDGEQAYPQFGMSFLKNVIAQCPKNFTYRGIQFQTDSKTMKNIALALNGKNMIANNIEQLLIAYSEAVEVIAFKQKEKENDKNKEEEIIF